MGEFLGDNAVDLAIAGIGAAGSAIGAVGAGGQELQSFGRGDIENVLGQSRNLITEEINRARAVRDSPITIPTLPGLQGISGPSSVAGLPSGTIGIFPQVEASALTPMSFNPPGQGIASSSVGSPARPPQGTREERQEGRPPRERTDPDTGDDSRRGDRPRPPGGGGGGPGGGIPFEIFDDILPGGDDDEEVIDAPPARPFGQEATAQGFVFADEQEQKQALNDIALTLDQLMKFKSRIA